MFCGNTHGSIHEAQDICYDYDTPLLFGSTWPENYLFLTFFANTVTPKQIRKK